jgi:hypothetical protein
MTAETFSNSEKYRDPVVHVVLFSGLFDSFVGDDGDLRSVLPSYRRLAELGMQIVFITRRSLDEATAALAGLQPPPVIVSEGGGASAPADHPFFEFFAGERERTGHSESTVGYLGRRNRAAGDIFIAVGIGPAGRKFLSEVELAAVFGKGEVVAPAVYRCRRTGPEAWVEWAEQMTRRVKIILNRQEMQRRDEVES